MVVLGPDGNQPSAAQLCYIVLLFASNLLIPRLPYRSPESFGALLLLIDTVFISLGLAFFSSASQDLLIGYFLCIIMATFADSEARVAGAAVLATLVYSFWLLRDGAAPARAALLIRLPFLFIATVFYGYMMARVRSVRAERMKAEARAEGLAGLLQITRSFSSDLASAAVVQRISTVLKSMLDLERCAIEVVVEDGSGEIEPAAAQAIAKREPVLATRLDAKGAVNSLLALPIVFGPEPLGALVIEAARPLQADEVEICQVIANTAAPALKNARQYEQLLQIEQTKAEFLNNLSHEMRTPLGVIVGYAEVAADHAARIADPELIGMLKCIHDKAGEITTHVESLLTFSDAVLGRERKRVERVDLGRILEQAVARARTLSRGDAIQFSLSVDPSARQIFADGGKLTRIAESLLLNAVKFTERGSIEVSAKVLPMNGMAARLPKPPHPWEQVLSLSIRDTGIGIGKRDIKKIFEDFRQGDGSLTRRYSGLGLGLSVSRRLAEIVGGAIDVESEPGKGSYFHLQVPVEVSPAHMGVE